MNQSAKALLQIAFLTLPMFGQTVPSLTTSGDGATIARDTNGRVLWQRDNSPKATATATVLTETGRPTVAATATWDPYTTLSAVPSSAVAGPIFDSLGNAWIVVGDTVNLTAVEWSGATQTWQTPHILGPAPKAGTDTVGLAVDQMGNVYVTYFADSLTGDAPFPLMWAKYSAATGWQGPSLGYNSPDSANETMPAIDSVGRLVVVYNGNGVSSIVYDPATSSWGGYQNLIPGSFSPLLPTVAVNKNGTRLALVYLQNRHGMQYTFFDSVTGQWNIPTLIPGSQLSTFSGGGPGSYYPIVVDDAGNVTLATSTYLLGRYGATGFRYESGQWTSQRLILPSTHKTAIDLFGSIALNPSGEVLVAGPINTGESTAITAFRYTPGRGWRTETAASYASGVVSRCRVAWYQSDQAVVVYAGANTNVGEQNALYSGGQWAPGPDLPGATTTLFPGMATAPNGNVLFTLSETLDGSGSVATWLHP